MIDAPIEEDSFTTLVIAELRSPAPASVLNRLGLFLLSLVVCVVALGLQAKPIDGAVLLGVVLLHELGHYLAMRALGYRDAGVFFVPFLGGAAVGDPSGVSPSKRGVVLLLGPLPGLVAGVVLARLAIDHPFARSVVMSLVFVNGLNLLPLEPLDGGRIVTLALAARERYVSIAFLIAGTFGLGLLAVKLKSYPLGLVAFLAFQMAMLRIRSLKASTAFAKSHPALPARLADADDATLRALVREVERAFPQLARMAEPRRVRAASTFCREAFERAQSRHPSALASAGLLLVQGAALATTALLAIWMVRSAPIDATRFDKATEIRGEGVTVHYPASFVPAIGGHSALVSGKSRGVPITFTVFVIPPGLDESFVTGNRPQNRVLAEGTEDYGGRRADTIDVELDEDGRTFHQHTCLFDLGDGRVVAAKGRSPAADFERVRADFQRLTSAIEIKP